MYLSAHKMHDIGFNAQKKPGKLVGYKLFPFNCIMDYNSADFLLTYKFIKMDCIISALIFIIISIKDLQRALGKSVVYLRTKNGSVVDEKHNNNRTKGAFMWGVHCSMCTAQKLAKE